MLPSLHGEYRKIYTGRADLHRYYSLLSPAAHVFDDACTRPQDEQNMYVRVDEEKVHSAEGLRALGIEVGGTISATIPRRSLPTAASSSPSFIDDKGACPSCSPCCAG